MLYLSLYFKTHREEYYELLQRVRTDGDWEAWVRFFTHGMRETAMQAVDTANRLVKLFTDDRNRIQTAGRAAGSLLRIHLAFTKQPVQNVVRLVAHTQLSQPTVDASMKKLATMGIISEWTGRQRGRMFRYDGYINILKEGTEPL